MPWLPPSRHRAGNRLDVDQKRLVLRRLDVGVTDIRRERIRAEALFRRSGESPVQRNADDVDGLAVADQRRDPLGDDSFGLDRSALGPDPYPTARLDAFLLRKLLRYFH